MSRLAGYVERGDAGVDWVTDFEAETGCMVTGDIRDVGRGVDEVHAGGYDVVSASGDLSFRLFENGSCSP